MVCSAGCDDVVAGELTSVGVDLVVIALSNSREVAYVPLEAIDEVVLT